MGNLRKPLQGTRNIIRFNWHFYVLAIGFALLIYMCSIFIDNPYKIYLELLWVYITLSIIISLIISAYVYDFSGFYKLNWLDEIEVSKSGKVINIHAGFDETSMLFQQKMPNAELLMYDFYNPKKHTEVSIKRARKAYSVIKNTQNVSTKSLPLKDREVDTVFAIFSAHEIRDENEREIFFKELKRIIKPDGQIVLVEHLRDLPNLLAYNVGFFHFMSKTSWYKLFNKVDLSVSKKLKCTPFVSIFILKNGESS